MHNEKIPVSTYRAFARDFNPVKYDPTALTALARQAGMPYVVITAKPHEGFVLHPSDVTDWDFAAASPYKKDLLCPLLESVHQAVAQDGLLPFASTRLSAPCRREGQRQLVPTETRS
jgi:alpha-L-fucosidase